jgi:hypothetical protein
MRTKLLLALACLLFLGSASGAQDVKKEKRVLSNADILLMTKNQLDDDTLIKLIQVSDTDFDTSGEALIDLKNQGVSSEVLRAMLQAAQHKRLAAQEPSAPPAASTTPSPSDSNLPSARNLTSSSSSPSPTDRTSPGPNTTSVPQSDASSNPAFAATGAQQNSGGMRINPQQMSGMQNPMAMMSMMGMGGMGGGFGSPVEYTADQLPHVFLFNDQSRRQKNEFPPSTAEIAQTKFNSGAPSPAGSALRSLATQGLSFASMSAGPIGMMAMSAFSMASGFLPGMRPGAPSMTYVWGLPGRKSARELTNTDPIFELNYGDIPGVDPDAFEPVIVKLTQSPDNYRLVGATKTKMNMRNMMANSGPENGKWLVEDRWPTRVYKEDRGFYVLRVDQPLAPGEYAVVLRPVKGYKAKPSGLGGHAQVFYCVWDFSVPGAPDPPIKKRK